MKQSLGILALGLALALTSCGGSTTPSESPTQVPPANEATQTATPAVADPPEEVTPSEGEPMDGAVSDRGLAVYKPGEAIDFISSDGQTVIGTMTINKIIANVKCDVEEVIRDKPENGRFIAFDLSVVTPPASGAEPEAFNLDPYAFGAVAENGTTVNGDVVTFGASTGCLEETIDSQLRPGRKSTGLYVLDVPKGNVVVTYEDTFSSSGWEIEVPAK